MSQLHAAGSNTAAAATTVVRGAITSAPCRPRDDALDAQAVLHPETCRRREVVDEPRLDVRRHRTYTATPLGAPSDPDIRLHDQHADRIEAGNDLAAHARDLALGAPRELRRVAQDEVLGRLDRDDPEEQREQRTDSGPL